MAPGGRGGGRGCSGAPRDPPSDLSPHAGIAAPSPAVSPQLFGASVGFRAPPGTARGHFWAEPPVERSFPRESLFPGLGGGSAARNGRPEMFFPPPIPLVPRISCEAFGSLGSARCVLWGEEDEECLPPIPAVPHSHSSSSPQERHRSMTRLSKVPSMTGEQSPPGSPNPLSQIHCPKSIVPNPWSPNQFLSPLAGAALTSSAASCSWWPSWATWWSASWVRPGAQGGPARPEGPGGALRGLGAAGGADHSVTILCPPAWTHGDPRKVIYPTDSRGQFCGQQGTPNE